MAFHFSALPFVPLEVLASPPPNDPARFSPCSLLIAFRAARRSAWCSGRRSRPDQSNPMILTVAVGALPRILYCIFTDVRRPLRPGASFGAVMPPAFTVPTASVSSARLSQPRTTFIIWTSAPSTASLTCLTSFFHRPPSVLISALGSEALSVCSPITNHWSAALAVLTAPSRTADAATTKNTVTLWIFIFILLYSFSPLVLLLTIRAVKSGGLTRPRQG